MATTFGVIQKSLRENYRTGDKKGITQEDLVELLKNRGVDVTQGYLAKIETTKTEPRRDYIRAICEVFNVHPVYVLGMESRPIPLTATASVEPSGALTPEGQQVGHLVDSLPTDFRQTMVIIAKTFAVAAETEKAKIELNKAWEMQWDLIEKIGGISLRARIEKELGVSSGSYPTGGGNKMAGILQQFISDNDA